MVESVTVSDVQAARALLSGVAKVTPMRSARWLAEKVGGPVDLKCENLQRAGSFKIRGAYTRLARLSDEERARGVVAASAGNHAQGVALAASMLGVRATVFMPTGAPIPKVQATRGYGADIRFVGTTIDECLVEARAFEAETGAVLIHPFDHPDIVAGQGTVGLEILEQRPDVRTIVVCTGGGGLLAGIAVAVKAVRPDVRIVGVQAAGAAAYPTSLAEGHPVALASMSTMADGIAVGRPGDVPFALVQDLVDEVRVVDDSVIARALVLTLERGKLVVEPAGAAGLAAVLEDPGSFDPPVVVVVSGGNVDPLLLLRVVRHGLAAGGRYSTLRVRMPDRPGSLAGLLAALAEADSNVVEVEHARIDPRLRLDEVEIEVQVETRGAEHRDAVLHGLTERGYHVVIR
ncbi:MAG TPA: threonine ammonia-lyase [Candidatus Angelobacter sp.]|nr:threonine ammonia-lyase [Candidatus Angelobacter sp.]